MRQIYATLLEQWLCIDGALVDDVMGETYERLSDLGLTCAPVSSWSPQGIAQADMQAYYHSPFHIQYELPTASPVDITLYNMLGQPMKQVFNGYQPSGSHQQQLPLSDTLMASGVYIRNSCEGNQQYSRPIRLTRGKTSNYLGSVTELKEDFFD
ncbi:MAG: T9SS type A sorting domain-containing protein [Saprospiraceae bacterium]